MMSWFMSAFLLWDSEHLLGEQDICPRRHRVGAGRREWRSKTYFVNAPRIHTSCLASRLQRFLVEVSMTDNARRARRANHAVDDLDRRFDSGAGRRAADVALQLGLGILPE